MFATEKGMRGGCSMEINIQPGEDLNELFEEKTVQAGNPFPVWVLPEPFNNLAIECKQSLNFPIDYTATSTLVAVATAIGTSANLIVKTGWNEYPTIYAMIVGHAGANKSHPMSKVFNVFNEIDKKAIDLYESLFKDYEEYNALSQGAFLWSLLPRATVAYLPQNASE
ncbi:MAG: YfjI family protein [Bacteroidota bacterium]|nr:YfjI family protein [Bacteroidota bacterium]